VTETTERIYNNDIEMEETVTIQDRERERIAEISRDLQMMLVEEKLNNVIADRNTFMENLRIGLEQAENLSIKVIDKYLKQWKINQKLFGCNFNFVGPSLDTIQSWCERLAKTLWAIKDHVSYLQQFTVEDQTSQSFLAELWATVSIVLNSLISGSFIVEAQPTQILKTNIKFSARVRLLVGNVLSLTMNNPVVNVVILSESQAQRIVQTNNMTGNLVCKIWNGSSSMEYNEATRHLLANFTTMKLENFKRPGRKAADCVVDEKFALWFTSKVDIGNMSFDISEISLPVVVTVHGIQEPQAWATILWDNSFALPDRMPFAVPDQVTWKQFSGALNQKFLSYNNRALTPENLHFLAEKLCNMSFVSQVPNDYKITWATFCKENLPNYTFTFWEWFYAALRVTKDHFRGPWEEGYIHGFMNKKRVEECLKSCGHGTFMLRFSDSEMGKKTLLGFEILK
jgi:signal transducer and activator of transcription 5B